MPNSYRAFLLRPSFLAALCLSAGPARAQDNAAAVAETLFRKGRDAMAAQDFDAACSYFSDSNELDPALGTLFNLALCERERNHIASAWSLYNKVLEKLPPHDPRIPVAEKAVAELEPRLPKLTVLVAEELPAGSVLTSNDLRVTEAMLGVALPVDPGEYSLRLEAPGHAASEHVVRVDEAQSETVTVQLGAKLAQPPPLGPPNSRSESASSSGQPGLDTAAPNNTDPQSSGRGESPSSASGPLPPVRYNLSLLHPIALQDVSERDVQLELGLVYSEVGSVQVGLAGGLLSAGTVCGVAWSFGATFIRGRTTGAALSNFLNLSTGPLDGVRFAGAANVQLAGDTQEPQRYWGAMMASGANVVVADFDGLLLAGLGNVTLGSADGAQISVLTNVTTEHQVGAAIAVFNNVAYGFSGLQLSFVNVSSAPSSGLQFGLVNIADQVSGVQIGVVNLARRVDGVSLGLLPYSIEGGFEPTTWSSTEYPANVGLGLTSGVFTTRFSAGVEPNFAPEISLGHEFPLFGFFIEPEVGYRVDYNEAATAVTRYRVPFRLALGKRLLDLFGIFGGGGMMLDVAKDTKALSVVPLAYLGGSLYL